MDFKTYSMDLGGRELRLEFGKYAEQASGATFVRYGDTCVLVTATVAETPRPGIDFFPLSVDYEEKMYAVGKIPGGFNKREGSTRSTFPTLYLLPASLLFISEYFHTPPNSSSVP